MLKQNPVRIALFGLIGILLYLLLVRVKLISSYSVDLEGLEFVFAHSVQLLMQGKPLYSDPFSFQFSATLYTPGYPYLLYALSGILKLGVFDLHQILVLGRVLSLLTLLLNAYVIYRLFQLFRLPIFYFIAGFTVYLLLITGHFYATRPDAMKTTLITIFLYSSLKYLFFQGNKKHLVLSVLAALAAVCLKQDAAMNVYLILLPACLYLRDRRSYLLAALFTTGVFAFLLACYLVFGKYFFANIILLNFQSLTDVVHSINLKLIGFSIARNIPVLLLVGIEGCHRFKKFREKTPEGFVAFAAIIAFVFSHSGMLRVGSNINHTFEALLLCLLSAAFAVRNFEPLILKNKKLLASGLLIYLVLLFISNLIMHTYEYHQQKEAVLKQEYFTTLAAKDALRAATPNGTVFFPNEKYTAFFPDWPMLQGHDLHRDRFIELYHGFSAPSKLSFASMENYDAWFKDGRVKYIVADNDERSKSHVSKYYPYYYNYALSGKFCIYRYRDS